MLIYVYFGTFILSRHTFLVQYCMVIPVTRLKTWKITYPRIKHHQEFTGICFFLTNYSYYTPTAVWILWCIFFYFILPLKNCDSILWQALTKVILDLYSHNFHYKPLYITLVIGSSPWRVLYICIMVKIVSLTLIFGTLSKNRYIVKCKNTISHFLADWLCLCTLLKLCTD